eukprot:1377100-Lingulodinium_polyedra.AAC.1
MCPVERSVPVRRTRSLRHRITRLQGLRPRQVLCWRPQTLFYPDATGWSAEDCLAYLENDCVSEYR